MDNTLQAMIHSLPPELLARVFHFLVPTSRHDCTLIKVTHVCRLFRAVVLDHAQLWSTIHVANNFQFRVFLSRSKSLLLDVTAIQPRIGAPLLDHAFVMILLPILDRLRSLDLTISGVRASESPQWSLEDFLASLVGRPAPNLHRLRIVNYGWSCTHPEARVQHHIFHVFDGKAYRSATPSLRSLSLTQVRISWNSDMFKNLSYLNLSATRSTSPTMKQLLDILRQCPTLETCTLALTHITSDASHQEREPAVALPLLSRLEILTLPPTHISTLLSHLILPQTTRFEVETTVEGAFDGDPHFAIFPEDREYLPALKELPSVELAVEASRLGTVCFTLFSSITGGQENLVATVYLDADSEMLESIAQGMPTTMLDTAKRFTYRGDPDDDSEEFHDWRATFRAARRLRVLCLVKPGSALVSALMDLTRRDDTAPDSPARFCPELTELDLDNVIMSDEARASLIWCLTDRKNAGSPMKKVVFGRASGLFPEYFVVLRELGVEVVRRPSTDA